jgi:hypothetical protein
MTAFIDFKPALPLRSGGSANLGPSTLTSLTLNGTFSKKVSEV